MTELFVSTTGNDKWSGRLPEPNKQKTDGPKASLEGALKSYAILKRGGRVDGEAAIRIRAGRYFLNQPMCIGPEHSGPLTISSFEGEDVIFDGGSVITGWRHAKLNGVAVWEAEVAGLLESRGRFRQLFVNGRRAPPCRLPKKGFYWMENVEGLDPNDNLGGVTLFTGQDRFIAAEGDLRAWRNLGDVEAVILYFWITDRIPLVSYDPATRQVRLAKPSRSPLVDSGSGKFAKYALENVVEGLTDPGEWVLDRAAGKVYYVPLKGERIEKTEIRASHLKQLLLIQGDPDKNMLVENVTIRGVRFEHADWVEPVTSAQSEVHVDGTIRLGGARNVSIEDCVLQRLGCYGVKLADGCSANRIVGCEMRDLGAGGIIADGADAVGPLCRRTGDNRFTDNHIHDCGNVFYAACGIITKHSGGNLISHNLIHDLYYTGVSCGWVWGYADSVSKENRIEWNHIHNLGKGFLSDMGGIYTLGIQPGTSIRRNLIHDITQLALRRGGRSIPTRAPRTSSSRTTSATTPRSSPSTSTTDERTRSATTSSRSADRASAA